MNQTQYERMKDYMRSCVADSAHAEDHVTRVTNAAMEICKSEPRADREALLCACLLHDIGRGEQLENPSRHHARVGAEKARDYLTRNGWDAAFAARVSDIIGAHSDAHLASARGVEARILFDADKLDVIGAIGACRTVAYGVEAGEPIYDADDFEASPSSSGGSMLREMENDYRFAVSSFLTARGRALAERKAAFSRAFMDALREEMAWGSALPGIESV